MELMYMNTSSILDRYERYVGSSLLETIYCKADKLKDAQILHINTTLTGGGVAEILEALMPITDALGIKHRRKVVNLDDELNHFTDHLVDMLQGNEPGDIAEQTGRMHLDKLSQELASLAEERADIYFVHDFQLVPLARLCPWMKPVIWVCHVDTAHPNPNAERYVSQFLDDYDLCLFNSQASVFKGLAPEHTRVLTLGIDPFRVKNAELAREDGMELLRQCGIDTQRPLLTQVARFGRWKNPWQAVDIYRAVKQHIPAVQLAFVGAMEAADDKGAVNVLHDLQTYAQGDADIHFLYDPQLIEDTHVNAFQRYSNVILQRSLREGFGLTVTEAMWKYQPVIGTSATGMSLQIVHGHNGYIADDTETAAKYAIQLLQDHTLWQRLGKNAHEYVQTHFLLPMMLSVYLDVVMDVRALRASTVGY
jgi:trehalose synthase